MVQYFISLCRRVVLERTKPQLRSLSSSRAPVKFSKKGRKVADIPSEIMALSAESEALLAPLRQSVKEQGDLVRQLKADKATEIEVKKAVAELKARKKVLEDKEVSLRPVQNKFDRTKMEDTLKRRFFYDQSFAIYGGVTGQFDFGPMGCAMKSNLLQAWRSHFVLEEQMLEVDCTVLTPEAILDTSGHVARFADLMVKDTVNGECFRLDHLIKAALEKVCAEKKTSAETKAECEDIGESCLSLKNINYKNNVSVIKLDGMNKEEMAAVLKKFDIKSPLTNNPLTEPIGEQNIIITASLRSDTNFPFRVQPDVPDPHRAQRSRQRFPQAGDRPGDLRQLQEAAGVQPGQAALRGSPDRCGLQERDLASLRSDPSERVHPGGDRAFL